MPINWSWTIVTVYLCSLLILVRDDLFYRDGDSSYAFRHRTCGLLSTVIMYILMYSFLQPDHNVLVLI